MTASPVQSTCRPAGRSRSSAAAWVWSQATARCVAGLTNEPESSKTTSCIFRSLLTSRVATSGGDCGPSTRSTSAGRPGFSNTAASRRANRIVRRRQPPRPLQGDHGHRLIRLLGPGPRHHRVHPDALGILRAASSPAPRPPVRVKLGAASPTPAASNSQAATTATGRRLTSCRRCVYRIAHALLHLQILRQRSDVHSPEPPRSPPGSQGVKDLATGHLRALCRKPV